jgi:anti-sigma regulatory factor (Ser/Thr protein kinase)/GNAT superfamily N-acetyltransferase
MSSAAEPSSKTQPELEIARVRITAEKSNLDALVDLVTDIAEANGISEKDALKLDQVLDDILENIVRYGFEGDAQNPVDIIISKRLHSLVVAVEDKGLPFDYDRMESGEEIRFKSHLSKHYADEVHFQSLGNRGNRTAIVKNLPAYDIREVMHISEHHEHVKAEPAPPDEPISIDMFDMDKVHELVRLVYKCYGYTYANEFMYYPEQIEARLKSGIMNSAGAYNSSGDLIGHLGFIYSKPGSRVVESGEAVVDPRYRGRGIFQMMKNYLKEYVAQKNVLGIYGEAVTIHPYSQKGSLELGGRETGYLLGYSPGTVTFHNISEEEKPRRQSVAFMYTPVSAAEGRKVYVPEVYKDMLANIYERAGFDRILIPEDENAGLRRRGKGRTNILFRHDHNQAFIQIDKPGSKTLNEIRFQLKHLTIERFDCIYLDIPLREKGAGYIASEARNMGFFFGCVMPEYDEGDALRLQYLNNVDISKDDIKTASEFGRSLLENIFEDKSEVSRI